MTKDKITICDIFNTDYGAYRLLRTRVQKIDSDPSFENWIACSAGEYTQKMKKMGVKIVNISIDGKSINPITDRSPIVKSNLRMSLKRRNPILYIHTLQKVATLVGLRQNVQKFLG